jgi:CheY-like chemotaxis protein
MTLRTVRLLHVEDQLIHQRMLAFHLNAISEIHFEIMTAPDEASALREFGRGTDIVVLDYNLAEGNGLQVLLQIRQRDPIVPVVALSGSATAEVAAELVRAGADDFIAKDDLAGGKLQKAVRSALHRADAVRKRGGSGPVDLTRPEAAFVALCHDFVASVGPEWLRRLEEFEAEARRAQMPADHLEFLLFAGAADVERAGKADRPTVLLLLRPLVLELALRLSESAGTDQPRS